MKCSAETKKVLCGLPSILYGSFFFLGLCRAFRISDPGNGADLSVLKKLMALHMASASQRDHVNFGDPSEPAPASSTPVANAAPAPTITPALPSSTVLLKLLASNALPIVNYMLDQAEGNETLHKKITSVMATVAPHLRELLIFLPPAAMDHAQPNTAGATLTSILASASAAPTNGSGGSSSKFLATGNFSRTGRGWGGGCGSSCCCGGGGGGGSQDNGLLYYLAAQGQNSQNSELSTLLPLLFGLIALLIMSKVLVMAALSKTYDTLEKGFFGTSDVKECGVSRQNKFLPNCHCDKKAGLSYRDCVYQQKIFNFDFVQRDKLYHLTLERELLRFRC